MKTPILATAALLLLAGRVPAAEGNPAGAPADWPAPVMDRAVFGAAFVDRLELGSGDGADNLLWDVQGWMGGDHRKLWIKSEGEAPTGHSPDVAELQALYSYTIARYWDLQTGARYDRRGDGEDTGYAVLGVQGLAPQWFETDTALFLSDDGDLSLRAEAEYDLLLTQRLVLQPRLEINASASDARALGVGSGLGSTEAGIRLRYEFRRELAPYIGVRWERLHGDTRSLARAEGEPGSRTWFVVGLRAWF